jgi:hypothetical protein
MRSTARFQDSVIYSSTVAAGMSTPFAAISGFFGVDEGGGIDIGDGDGKAAFDWSANSTAVINGVVRVRDDCVNVSTTGAVPAGSSEAYIAFRVAVEVYLVGALCVAGLLGNALSIAVLYRDRREDDKRNTTNWLLQVCLLMSIN